MKTKPNICVDCKRNEVTVGHLCMACIDLPHHPLSIGAVFMAEQRRLGKLGPRPKYWTGTVPDKDDFGQPIRDVFIDGKTVYGPWAMMTPASHVANGMGLGTGLGQKYRKHITRDGSMERWYKIEG